MQAGHTVEIARRGFTGVIREFRRHVLPLVEAPRETNGFRGRGEGKSRRAFEAAHVRHELPVVVVTVTALHGLDVAAELLVELIHEGYGTIRFAPASGDPFIPAGRWGDTKRAGGHRSDI